MWVQLEFPSEAFFYVSYFNNNRASAEGERPWVFVVQARVRAGAGGWGGGDKRRGEGREKHKRSVTRVLVISGTNHIRINTV